MAADPIVYCLEHLTDYTEFERLCHELMALEGYASIEPLGGCHDKGRDAIHVNRGANVVTIFCYSVRDDWFRKLKQDAEVIHRHRHACSRLTYLSTYNFTPGERDDAVKFIQQTYGWELDPFGLERLRLLLSTKHSSLIANHPQVFHPRFFARASSRCGSSPDGPETVEDLIARYRHLLDRCRGYTLGQIIRLNGLTNLAAWRRAKVNGTLRQLKALCDSREALLASHETASLIWSLTKVASCFKHLTHGPTQEEVEQRDAWEKWSQATLQLGRVGPRSDAGVQAWQRASLAFLNASLTAITSRERRLVDAVQRWVNESTAMVRGNTLYNRALAKARSGESEGARADYEAVLATPNLAGVLHAAARFDLALMKTKAGDQAGALAEYSSLLELPDIHPHQLAKALLNRGRERSEVGDLAGALADFDALIDLPEPPRDERAMAFFNRAALKVRAGDRDGALADLDVGLALPDVSAKKRGPALFSRGMARTESGDCDGAVADFDALVDLSDIPLEQRVQALLYCGIQKSLVGDPTAALVKFDTALALTELPLAYKAQALLNRGNVRLEAGDEQGALADYNAVLDLPGLTAEHRVNALIERAWTKGNVGDVAGSLADYDSLLAITDLPAELRTEVIFNRGVTKYEQGDWAGARTDFDAVLMLPCLELEHQACALFSRAGAMSELGDWPGALADYDSVLALPDLPAELRAQALSNRDRAKREVSQ